MRYPNIFEEKKLWRMGYNLVAGLDEAGRGPLAGPVVAAAVLIKNKNFKVLRGIKDSKKLSAKQREFFYNILTKHKDIKWGIGIVSEKVIDKINILEATKLAMKKALRHAQGKLKLNPDFLILDGNFRLDLDEAGFGVPKQKSIIAGDMKVFSCCASGIIAKVTRDKIMQEYHKKYPEYGFDRHKGYGTLLHFKNIEKFGPCKIHRKTFWPISSFSA